MNKKIRKMGALLLSLAMLAAAMPAQGIWVFAAEMQSTGTAARTILLYGCGADLESENGFLTGNLMQVLNASIPEDVNFLVLTGGSKEFQMESEYLQGQASISGEKNQIWRCSGAAGSQPGKMNYLCDLPKQEKTPLNDPGALQAFIDYGAANFPADKYDLILWDHGGGPSDGFGYDERGEAGDLMSLAQIAGAIKKSAVDRFDIIDFDACLMGNVEIVTGLSMLTDNVVASPELEPGDGQEYEGWLNALAKDPDMEGYLLGRKIVDSVAAYYTQKEKVDGYGDNVTLSVVNTKNFRERLLPKLITLTEILISQSDDRGSINNRINFYDELISKDNAIAYFDGKNALYDLGNFVVSLGVCLSEVDNCSEADQKTWKNSYTALSKEITAILKDQNFDGNDVLYTWSSSSMEKVVDYSGSPVTWVIAKQQKPTGLSLYFAEPSSVRSIIKVPEEYVEAIDKLKEEMEDETGETLLTKLQEAAIRYTLVNEFGRYVSQIRACTDRKHITYRGVKAYLFEDGYEEEGDPFAALEKKLRDLTSLTEGELEDWLTEVVAQQAEDVFTDEYVSVVPLTTSNNKEGFQITVDHTPLQDVDRVRLLSAVPFNNDGYDKMIVLQGHSGSVSTDYFRNTAATNEDVKHAMYQSDFSSFEVESPSMQDCFVLVDGENHAHLVSIDMDLSEQRGDYYIPVEMQLPGEEDAQDGYLVARNNGNGGLELFGYTWFSEQIPYPVFSLKDEAFKEALISPRVEVLVTGLPDENGKPVTDFNADRSLGLERIEEEMFRLYDSSGHLAGVEKTSLSRFAASLTPEERSMFHFDQSSLYGSVTDIYGYEHNVTKQILEARAAKTASRVSIAGSKVSIALPAKVAYNGKNQRPKLVLKSGGRTLKQGRDYEAYYFGNREVGTGYVVIYGKGGFYDRTVETFVIAQAKTRVTAARTISKKKLQKASQTALRISTLAPKNRIFVSLADTPKKLRRHLVISGDKKTIRLKKGAKKGVYKIRVSVSGGSSKTYSNLKKTTYTIRVK